MMRLKKKMVDLIEEVMESVGLVGTNEYLSLMNCKARLQENGCISDMALRKQLREIAIAGGGNKLKTLQGLGFTEWIAEVATNSARSDR